MAINVIAEIQPKNNGNFPVIRDDNFLGGWRVVADITARNNIPSARRKEGMYVRVIAADKIYTLSGGIDNSNWVEASGGGGTGTEWMTTSDINMVVNYSTGTSPPIGTMVHNQGEYDALGYSLKYVQDAIDILPLGIGNYIIITLEDGNHFAKPDASGFTGYGALVLPKPFITLTEKFNLDTPTNFQALIHIKGINRTVVGAVLAGTCGIDSSITRSSGTWTAGVLKGKMACVVTGTNAGVVFPIINNTTTEIFGPPVGLLSGACTFEVYDPSAIVYSSTDGVNQDSLGYWNELGGNVPIIWENVQMGTSAIPFSIIISGFPPTIFTLSEILSSEINVTGYNPLSVYLGSSLSIVTSALHIVPTCVELYVSSSGSRLQFDRSFIYGASSSSLDTSIEAGLIAAALDGTLDLRASIITPDSGYSNDVIQLLGGRLDIISYISSTSIHGNGLCTGLMIRDKGTSSASESISYLSGTGLNLGSCSIGVNVAETTILKVPTGIFGSADSFNVVGWNVARGSKVLVNDPSLITCTGTNMVIDGENHAYTELVTAGDQITATGGSSVLRTAT